MAKEECLICKAPLEYLNTDIMIATNKDLQQLLIYVGKKLPRIQ